MGEEVKWTDEQKEAIEYKGSNLLVSAAAGSGKTTVMIERISRLIKSHVPINNFLVLTFTKASAADMKNKLTKSLSKLMSDPFILEQIDDLPTADVSNLHSFCARLLKSYFYEVGLDPTFIVLDEQDVEALKQKALVKLFNQKSEKADKDFFELVDIFSKSRKDEGLKEVVLSLYNYLCSIVDREQWFKETVDSLYDPDLSKNQAAKVINRYLKAEKSRLKEAFAPLMAEANELGETKLIEYLQKMDSALELISYNDNFVNNAKRVLERGASPRIPRATQGHEFLYERVNAVKEEMSTAFKKIKENVVDGRFNSLSHDLEISRKRVENLFSLTLEFEKEFKALKKEKGGLDFNDLEQYTLEVLNNQELREEIKNKYDYVLVDEYQDINHVQEKIISLISRGDNRFMVGDVKQSIYRFRLCVPEIFLEKYNMYEANETIGKLIKLNANFRSKSQILNFVNAIFARTMTEDFGGVNYEKDASLLAGDKKQIDDEQRVGLMFAKTSKGDKETVDNLEVYSVKEDNSQTISNLSGQAEGIMIAHKISELVKSGKIIDKNTKKPRLIRFSDITILTQSRNENLAKIVKTLEDFNIPVSTDAEGDCLEDEYVFGIKSFLECVNNYKVDYSLFSCLFSKVFGFTADELAAIKIAGGGHEYYFEEVKNALSSDSLDEQTKAKLGDFFDCLSRYRGKARYLPVSTLATELVSEKNLEEKIAYEKEHDKHKQKLQKFLASLPETSLAEYINEQAQAEVTCPSSHSQGAVKVMTIHKSKGLEFPVVFVVLTNKQFNFKSMKEKLLISSELGPSIYYYYTSLRFREPTLARQAVKMRETRKLLEEQQRLLYVALTRATDYLFVTASGDYDKIKEDFPVSPTSFMDFMGDLFTSEKLQKQLGYTLEIQDADQLIQAMPAKEQRQVLITSADESKAVKVRNIFDFEYPYKKSLTTPLKTAVTSVIEEEKEAGVDYVLSEDMAGTGSSAKNGTLQHKVLEMLDLSEKTREEIQKKVDRLAELGVISEEDKKEIEIDQILKLIQNPEFAKMVSSAKKIKKENEFFMLYGADGENSVVQGVVDLCLFIDGGLVIVDYKTGRLSGENMAKYAKQLDLYSEAMQRCYNLPVTKRYIASLAAAKLIEV